MYKKKFYYIFFIFIFLFCKIATTQPSSSIDENFKCQFLIDKLTPQDQSDFKKKFFLRSIKFLIPAITTLAVYKLISPLFKTIETDKYIEPDITNLYKDNLTSKVKNSKDLLNKKRINFYILSLIVYSSTLISYLITNSVIKRIEKQKTSLDILNDFLNSWQEYKYLTPEIFHEKFENLYLIFNIRKNLEFSETEASAFIENLLIDIIDYKCEISGKNFDNILLKKFKNKELVALES